MKTMRVMVWAVFTAVLAIIASCGGGGGGGVLILPPSPVEHGVATFAGPAGGAGAIDATGAAALFNFPNDVATDGTNLYIADTANHTIRQIVIVTGAVTTLAGTAGAFGSTDGTGAAARFNQPCGIATDGTNLYVADTLNHAIRQIVIGTGAVTTLAGTAGSSGSTNGTGAAARFYLPRKVATDGTNLYVADTYNHTIRQIVIGTGAVTTLAGTAGSSGSTNGTGAAALFNQPYGIATDGTNLYVADTGNHTIRQIVIGTGAVTTLAGTPGLSGSTDGTGAAARFYYPYDVATDGTNLYVADTSNFTIRWIVISTGAVTTLAGTAGSRGSTDGTGAAARFRAHHGIGTDGTNLYVADTYNHTIRQVVISSQVVTTLAGTAGSSGSTNGTGAAAQFYSPNGIATDGTNLYVADRSNYTIRQIVISTGAVTTLAGTALSSGSTDGTGAAARFKLPSGITTDGTNLYVADTFNHTIRQIVISTGVVTTLAGTAGSTGSTNGTGAAALFYYPYGIVTDGTNLYVADTYNHTIRQIVISSKVVTTLAGTAGISGSTDATGAAARFDQPNGITTDGTNLYVADTFNHTIRQIVISTGVVTTLAGTAGSTGSTNGTGAAARFKLPSGITTAGANLYVADTSNSTIRQIEIGTGAVTTLTGSTTKYGTVDGSWSDAVFFRPYGIVSGGTGLPLYVTTENHNIRKIY